MAKNRNCPNCGAPYEVHLSKCPYCGTSYFDMSALDFNNKEPFYLKFRAGDMIITQLVRPCLNDVSMDISRDEVDVTGFGNKEICSFIRSYSVKTNISFEAVEDPHGHMFEIYKEV